MNTIIWAVHNIKYCITRSYNVMTLYKFTVCLIFFQSRFKSKEIKQWKMQEIWNPFHRQNRLISKGFSNFKRTSSKSCPFFKCSSIFQTKIILFHAWNGRKTDFVFSWNFYVVWGLLSRGSSYLTSGIPFLVSWPLALLVLMCSERGFVGKKTHEPCLLFQIGLTFFRRNKRYQ